MTGKRVRHSMLLLLLLVPGLLSGGCGPKPGSDQVRVRLDNGITLIVIRARNDSEAAVEVFYRAGFAHEPSGKPHVAHLAEHLWLTAAAGGRGPGEIMAELGRRGLVNGETLGDFVHFDYLVPVGELGAALDFEAARLTDLRFTDEDVAREAERMLQEVDFVLGQGPGGLIKFGLLGMTQAVNHGASRVAVYEQTRALGAEDARAFMEARYSPRNMTVAIVADLDPDAVVKLVDERLGALEPGPAPPAVAPGPLADGSYHIAWDLDAAAVYIVDPNPPAHAGERLALTLFGNLLAMELQSRVQGGFCSNQLYPVGDLPFFVFGQAAGAEGLDKLESELLRALDSALDKLDARSLGSAAQSLVRHFMESSLLGQKPPPGMERRHVLLQEALNAGVKEMLRQGLSPEEFKGLVADMDFAAAAAAVKSRLRPDNLAALRFSKSSP